MRRVVATPMKTPNSLPSCSSPWKSSASFSSRKRCTCDDPFEPLNKQALKSFPPLQISPRPASVSTRFCPMRNPFSTAGSPCTNWLVLDGIVFAMAAETSPRNATDKSHQIYKKTSARSIVHTSDISQLSDTAIPERLGQRLAHYRLNRNLTQEQIALEAGVSRRSVSKLENGHVVDTRILIRILRALGLISQLDTLAPEQEASPITLLEARSKERLRASGSRESSPSSAAEQPGAWK